MIFWTMKRNNGDWAYVRTCGREFCADVTTSTGRNGNAAWPETFKTATECRRFLEKYGFRIA